MYIAVEGIDTAGKSTQIKRLSRYFPDAIFTKEPGGTQAGERIRDIVLSGELRSKKAELLLFLADRAEHVERVIKPNKEKLIISDRSAISGVAYALAQNLVAKEELVALHRFATDDYFPQKAFLLRLTPEALTHRLSQKSLDGIEKRGAAYLLRIQDAIVEAANALGIKLVIIDATLEEQRITETIYEHLKR